MRRMITINEMQVEVDKKIQEITESIKLHSIGMEDLSITTDEYGTIITIAAHILDPNKHHHLMFEIEGSSIHYGSDCVLHPYALGNVCFVSGRINVNGTFKDYTCSLDDDGTVIINLIGVAVAIDTEDIKIHYQTLID